MDDDLVLVEVPRCILCGKTSDPVLLPRTRVEQWRKGGLIQRVFPEMSADQRELLMSGTHPECFDRMFR